MRNADHGAMKEAARAGTSGSPSLLVVGNGPTAVADNGDIHVERQLGELLLDLQEDRYDVAFLQPMIPFEPSLTYWGCVLPPGRPKAIRFESASRFRGAFRVLLAIRRASFVYLFYPGTLSRLVARVCRMISKPYALYVRGEQFSARRDAALFAGAKFITTVSPALLPIDGAADARVSVIRPMLEISPADAVRRRQRPIDDRPARLLFIGRLEADKGIPELVEAMSILRDRGTSAELSLIGGGPLHDQLITRARTEPDLGLHVEGVVGDRARIMRDIEQSDVFVLPTHHEGFPRVLYEAMIKSAAVVTTMVGGIPALMRDGVNCLAVPVGDATAIANAVDRLISDNALRQQLIEAAMDTVLEVLAERPTHSTLLRQGLRRTLHPRTK